MRKRVNIKAFFQARCPIRLYKLADKFHLWVKIGYETNGTFYWSFSSAFERSWGAVYIQLVEIECSAYIRLVDSEWRAPSHWLRAISPSSWEHWDRGLNIDRIPIFWLIWLLWKQLNVWHAHAFSTSNVKRSPHRCKLIRSAVGTSRMYHNFGHPYLAYKCLQVDSNVFLYAKLLKWLHCSQQWKLWNIQCT